MTHMRTAGLLATVLAGLLGAARSEAFPGPRSGITITAGGGVGARWSGGKPSLIGEASAGAGAFVIPDVAIVARGQFTTVGAPGTPALGMLGLHAQWFTGPLFISAGLGLALPVGHAEPDPEKRVGSGLGYFGGASMGWTFYERPRSTFRFVGSVSRSRLRDGYSSTNTVLSFEWQLL